MDGTLLLEILPPVLTALFAYSIAKKKNSIAERINAAKIDADTHSRALEIVRDAMNDMRDEFRREISKLHLENDQLKTQVRENVNQIQHLQSQVRLSDELIERLKSEILLLQSTVKMYEDEIARLRKI